MGTELGATASVFPSDSLTKKFLAGKAEARTSPRSRPNRPRSTKTRSTSTSGRWSRSSLARRVRQREAGSRGRRDRGRASRRREQRELVVPRPQHRRHALDGKHTAPGISVAVSPGSRQTLLLMLTSGLMTKLIKAGVRELEVRLRSLHRNGIRAADPRPVRPHLQPNFEGRSGTPDDLVYLCSPETAAAAAFTARSRTAGSREAPDSEGADEVPSRHVRVRVASKDRSSVQVIRGPNIARPHSRNPPKDTMTGGPDPPRRQRLHGSHHARGREDPPRCARTSPRSQSNVFEYVDPTFPERAKKVGGGFIVSGENYGQGSSREHAGSPDVPRRPTSCSRRASPASTWTTL